jgi:hypothetical protein
VAQGIGPEFKPQYHTQKKMHICLLLLEKGRTQADNMSHNI